MTKRAEHETGDARDCQEPSFHLWRSIAPLARHEEARAGTGHRWSVLRPQLLLERRKAGSIEVVLPVVATPVHRPEVVPHRWASRRVLVDHEVVDDASPHPVAPRQRGVAERRTEHIAAGCADA